jgi:hypothetical protein
VHNVLDAPLVGQRFLQVPDFVLPERLLSLEAGE